MTSINTNRSATIPAQQPDPLELIAAAQVERRRAEAADAAANPPIIDGMEQIAILKFDRSEPMTVYINGEDCAALYSIDRDARAVVVNYSDPDGREHVATIRAADDEDRYLAARHTAREHLRLMGQPLPQRSATRPAAAPDQSRPWIGERIDGRGYSIAFDGDAHRTRISFDRRPDDRIIRAVQAAGFHWSPAGACWLGKLDNAHRNAAQLLTMTFDAGL